MEKIMFCNNQNEKCRILQERKIYIIVKILIGILLLDIAASKSVCLADSMEPLDIRQVKVGGEIGRRIDITINNNVLVLDADKDFLRPFQERNRPEGYIGLGKFIDSLVRLAAYSDQPELLALKNHVIAETIKTQEEDGYIGIILPDNRMWRLWDIHEMGYLILGLTNDYKYFRENSSLQAAEKLTRYIIDHWPHDQHQDTLAGLSIYLTTTGLEEAILTLYGQTKEQDYLDFCVNHRKLPQWNVGIVEGRWGLAEGHAYHYLCRCLAQLRLNDIQPDDRLMVNSQKAMDYLLRRDGLLIPGLCSFKECWHSNQQGFTTLGETCSTAYLIRWLDMLLQIEGDSIYGDIIERGIYNGLFAAQSPDGRRLRYYSPMEGPRIYFDMDTYCCPCNYRRIVAELPGMIYYKCNDGLAVNLYTDSSADIQIKEGIQLHVSQKTDYPNSGDVVIDLNPEKPVEFPLRLRIPRWCRKAGVCVNGKDTYKEIPGGNFITIQRQWHPGDQVKLQMPMTWRLVKGRKSQAGRVAVMRGPQLFCLNPDRQDNFSADMMRFMAIDPTSPELSDPDQSIRPQGLTCKAKFWSPSNYWPSAAPDFQLTLTEYPDPGCQQTYFQVINPNLDILVEDELCESIP